MEGLSPKSMELLQGLQNLQGRAEDIKTSIMNQTGDRRNMHEVLIEVVGVLKGIIPGLRSQQTALRNTMEGMSRMSVNFESLLQDASEKQISILQDLRDTTGLLDPPLQVSQKTMDAVHSAISDLNQVLSQVPAAGQPAQGGRRRRRKGGYTYRKTKTRSTKTRRTRK